jgi:hypothetical protein
MAERPECETAALASPPSKKAKRPHAAAVSWGEIDTILPDQLMCGNTSERDTSSAAATASAAVSTCSPDQIDRSPCRDAATPFPRPRVSTGRRGYARRAPRPLLELSRLAARCLATMGQRASMRDQ